MSERDSKASGPDPGTENGGREGASEEAKARVRESFDRQGLMGLLGAQIVEVGHGTCEIELPFRDEITQQQRYFHGAVAGAIGDSAGGYAALTLAPPDREVLTVEYKVNFLAPAQGEKLVARGKVLTAGRRLFVCRTEVIAMSAEGEETQCAALQQTVATTPAQTA
jgi:uncharacterized protein (TIGR00369 family)